MRVLLAGGGTAGHIEPALATADALRRLDPHGEVRLLGTAKGLESTLVPARGYPLDLVAPVPLPRRPAADLFRLPSRLRAAIRDTRSVIERERIDVVAGFGGYVSVPAYLAARHRVPIVVHEANARPGIANRLGVRWAACVATATTAARLAGAHDVGMPLRRSIATLDRHSARPAARESLGWTVVDRVLVVTGGSQGARRLNLAVIGAARRLLASGIKIWHIAGPKQVDEVAAAAADAGIDHPGYRLDGYIDDMSRVYAAADLLVCRAGAMTVAEVTALGLPAVYVPLPIGNGEQRLNAEPIVEAGGGRLVADAELTADVFFGQVDGLMSDSQGLEVMGRAAAEFGRRDADEQLARLILGAARMSQGTTR